MPLPLTLPNIFSFNSQAFSCDLFFQDILEAIPEKETIPNGCKEGF